MTNASLDPSLTAYETSFPTSMTIGFLTSFIVQLRDTYGNNYFTSFAGRLYANGKNKSMITLKSGEQEI